MAPEWDYYKIRRNESRKLTRSKKSRDGFRGLIHGKKGVSKHAELFRATRREARGRRPSGRFFSAILRFTGKCVLVVGAIGATILIAGWVLATIFTSVGAGLAELETWLTTNSLVVSIGISAIAGTGILVIGVKFRRVVGRWHEARELRLEHRERRAAIRTAAEAAAHARAASSPTHAALAPVAAPDWYSDPMQPSQLRYWDGRAWTTFVHPAQAPPMALADWYPDPSHPGQFRYWDGTSWTSNVRPVPRATPGQEPATGNGIANSLASANGQPRVTMTSAEWQGRFRTWMTVGAVEEELLAQLTNALISDADEQTLEAQVKLREMPPEQGAQRIKLALEANPGLRQVLRVDEFLTRVLAAPQALLDNSERKGIGQPRSQRDPR